MLHQQSQFTLWRHNCRYAVLRLLPRRYRVKTACGVMCHLKRFFAATRRNYLPLVYENPRGLRLLLFAIPKFGSLHCRKYKEEVKSCRKFRICNRRLCSDSAGRPKCCGCRTPPARVSEQSSVGFTSAGKVVREGDEIVQVLSPCSAFDGREELSQLDGPRRALRGSDRCA